jgi:molybdenum transport protein
MSKLPTSVLPSVELHRLLAEDAPYGDLTTQALGIGTCPGVIRFAAREMMTVAAIEDAATLLGLAGVDVRLHARSGDTIAAAAPLLEAEGTAGALHRAWKVAQTLVEVWSGIATAAKTLVAAAQDAKPNVVVACTRKNIPGTKALAVAAVRAGGATMHRLGLSETVLVFPEHLAFRAGGDLQSLTRDLRARLPEKKLVIEVMSVAEGEVAAAAGFDVIQTEKFSPEAVAELAGILTAMPSRPVLAAAGGISPANAANYVRAGADVLVTSWPYTARPADVAVEIAPKPSLRETE